MISKQNLNKFIELKYPQYLAEDWDNVGFLVDSKNESYSKVLLTIDVNEKIIKKADDEDIRLIISHHPLHLGEINRNSEKLIGMMNSLNISLFTIHTNAEKAENGVSKALAESLNLSEIKRFPNSQYGVHGIFDTPKSVDQIIRLLRDILPFNHSGIKVSGKKDKLIKSLGLCAGSGGDLIHFGNEHELDAFVTSDIKHHQALQNLASNGPILFSVSHWAGEFGWLKTLKKELETYFYLDQNCHEVQIYEESTDPWDLCVGAKS
jgi:dinuclear metal center YbgI/SA1388 family protein